MTLLSIQDLKVAFRMGKVGGVVQRAEAAGCGTETDVRVRTPGVQVGIALPQPLERWA